MNKKQVHNRWVAASKMNEPGSGEVFTSPGALFKSGPWSNDLDGWIFDLRYLVNGKETYSCQIINPDVPGRIKRLESEGFKNIPNEQTIKK